MSKNRVIWNEGLFLRPQHFQQQDRFLQHWVESRCGGLRPYAWGITKLELDESLLALGKLAINSCRGVLPDGTPFDIPENTPPPTPLEIPEDMKNCRVFLALPLAQPDRMEVVDTTNKDDLGRYNVRHLHIKDLHTEKMESQAELQIGELKLRFLPETEKQDAFAVIPLVHVVERRKDSTVILDQEFIPTVMFSGANDKISSFIKETQGLLNHRGEALSTRIAAGDAGGIDEMRNYLLLQLVNRFEGVFKHLNTMTALHPEDFYRTATELAGELATFTQINHRPVALAAYKHTDLQASFTPLMDELRRSFNMVMDQRAIQIPLTLHKFGVWSAIFKEKPLLSSADFVLGAKASISQNQLRTKFPKQTTMASVEIIRNLVNAHLPGIKLSALSVVPRQIPYHTGFSYFEVDVHSKYWKELKTSGGLAIHIGTDLPNLELELWAIREKK